MLPRHARSAGVTLLELLTVIVVIAILATMLIPAISNMASRMDRAKCTMNLKAVYLGTEFYLQDRKQWPQIDPRLAGKESDEYARLWMAALQPYKVSKESWHCPSVQKVMLGDIQDPAKPRKERIDYFPTTFDDKEITPHRWSGQPWFIERGAVHGEGNLMIFPDGSIKTLDDIMLRQKK
jgi:prepilin-type N-terminal cleavage/methylation domain-containing protein